MNTRQVLIKLITCTSNIMSGTSFDACDSYSCHEHRTYLTSNAVTSIDLRGLHYVDIHVIDLYTWGGGGRRMKITSKLNLKP